MAEFEPTGWWRSLLNDGSLWGESSDEAEIRRMAKQAPKDKQPVTIQRHMRRVEERWEDAPSKQPKAREVETDENVPQFTVRCADGEVIAYSDPGALYGVMEDAASDARTYDATCLCVGPHEVLVRHITTTDWARLLPDSEGPGPEVFTVAWAVCPGCGETWLSDITPETPWPAISEVADECRAHLAATRHAMTFDIGIAP